MELKIVLVALCVGFVHCRTSYKAAVVDSSVKFNEDKAVSTIHEAAQLNVDILMLPQLVAINHSNKVKQALADAAKQGKIYVAAQIADKTEDRLRSLFVFDRNGTIISEPASHRDTLVTDFGVTFSVVNEEELLVLDAEGPKDVIAYGSISASQFLYGLQASGAWAYSARSNVITASAIYGGLTRKHGGLVVADLDSASPDTFVIQHHFLSNLDDHTSEPLRSSGRQRVCHEEFCCDFDVTTKSGVELPYSLLSFSGVKNLGAGPVLLQTCALSACGGDDSCLEQLVRNKTNIFEKVSIGAYFNTNSKQFPVLISAESTYDDVTFIQRNQTGHASIELLRKEVTSLGIFAISKDLEAQNVQEADDDLSEFFDYLWIRLRVAIFIVSIYVLEMM